MIRNTKGFTLIELLIVVVIIGILAAIAIPKFAGTKNKAYEAAMKSDLKNLSLAQESYYSDANPPGYGSVNPGAALMSPDGATTLWTATTGVDVTAVGAADGFGATATHQSMPGGRQCGVYVGAVGNNPSPGNITNEGEVACW